MVGAKNNGPIEVRQRSVEISRVTLCRPEVVVDISAG